MPKAMTKSAPKKAAKPPAGPRRSPKSEGDGGVQAYIAALPDWQAALARRIDAIVVRQVPDVRKAIKWHTPMYGIEGQGWFMAIGGFKQHMKLNFFKGTSLKPVPPAGEGKDMRALDIRESDKLDEKQLTSWVKQASSIPGWGKG